MSVSVKALIFVLTLWITLQAIGNWFDGQTDILTAQDVSVFQDVGSVSAVTSTETTGESSNFFNWGSNTMNAINKILFFKFSFWFENFSGYTVTTCTAAGGEFNSATSVCSIPNAWHLIWYWIFRPMGLAFLIAFVAIGIGILRGR
jgi:hypothetical protein